MSGQQLDYPPVLTPGLLGSLNGRLSSDQRAELKDMLGFARDQFFAPFANSAHPAGVLEESIRKYHPFRLQLAARLFEILGRATLAAFPRLLAERWGPGHATEWYRIGVSPEWAARIFARYAKAVEKLLAPGWQAQWPAKPTDEVKRLWVSFLEVASALDFVLCLLGLALEGEIRLEGKGLEVTHEAAEQAMERYEAHVAALWRAPAQLGAYLAQLLMERGLLLPGPPEGVPDPGSRVRSPLIPMTGKPLSEMILEDRR